MKLSPLLLYILLLPCIIYAQDLNQELPDAQGVLREVERSQKLQTKIPEEAQIDFDFNLFGPLAEILLWAGLAVIAALVIYKLVKNYRREFKAEPDNPAGVSAGVPASVRMKKAQMAADELAAMGRFAEAMHMLLLQSLEELKRRLNKSIASSLTSREILFSSDLPGEGYFAFSDIVLRVENSHFGTYEPTAEEYAACRQSYDTFTAVLSGG